MNVPFDPGATQALKRASPFWASIRETVTLRVAVGLLISLLATSIAAIVQFAQLRRDVTSLSEAIKNTQAHDTELAVLQQRVHDIEQRFDRFDRAYDNPDPRLRRHH